MYKKTRLMALVAVFFFAGFGAAYAGETGAQTRQPLHIDVPVKLDKANVVFDIGHLVLNGDMPFSSETWIFSPAISATRTSNVKLLPSFTETLLISC